MRLALGSALLLACNSPTPPPATGPCTAYFSGDVTDTATVPQCAALSIGDAGSWALDIGVSSPRVPEVQIEIDFPALPAPGNVSSDTVGSWSVVQSLGADACSLGAGSAAVPTGSFTLALQSIVTDEGAATATAHGTLDLVLYVHAPAMTDCGPHDVENVEVRF